MTNLIPHLISQGIPQQVILYVLIVPLLASLISFLRQFVGMKSLGVYHPLLLTFAFVGLGIGKGLTVFLVVVVLANIISYLVKKFSLLYLPRTTIVLTTTTVSVLALVLLVLLSGYQINLQEYFPLVIILALSDRLVSSQIKRNLKRSLFLIAGTLVASVIGYYLVNFKNLQYLILAYPFIYLFFILVINIFLGRYRGLRLNELWRFRRLLKSSSKK